MRSVTTAQQIGAVVGAAAGEGLPTLVKFGAKWCSPCRAMEPLLQRVQDEGLAAVVSVDIDEAPQLAKAFQVRSIPTLVVYHPNGKQAGVRAGAMRWPELARFIALG